MKKIIIFFFSFLFLSASASSHVTHYQQFKSIEMEIFRNDKLIGINNFYFSKENDLMKVKNIVQFKISIAGIDLMKVDSESSGIYKDDMLIKFNSKTKQNDKDKFVNFSALAINLKQIYSSNAYFKLNNIFYFH